MTWVDLQHHFRLLLEVADLYEREPRLWILGMVQWELTRDNVIWEAQEEELKPAQVQTVCDVPVIWSSSVDRVELYSVKKNPVVPT